MTMLPRRFRHAVVAIGDVRPHGTEWIASGFFYGQFIMEQPDGSGEYRIFLVTNRHVSDSADNPVVRVNPSGTAPATEHVLELTTPSGTPQWVSHPNPEVDVSVMGIDLNQLGGYDVSFFADNIHSATVTEMAAEGVEEGSPLFLLGFPMGMVGEVRSAVIARGGMLARFQDVLERRSLSMLVDGLVFPGNSGGPVVSKPEAFSVTGSEAPKRAVLVGIVAAFVPYREVAVSQQTGQPRIEFSENSGLSIVFSVDTIKETIAAYELVHPLPPIQTRGSGTLEDGTVE